MSRIGDATSSSDVRCEVYSLLLASINILVTLRFTRLVFACDIYAVTDLFKCLAGFILITMEVFF